MELEGQVVMGHPNRPSRRSAIRGLPDGPPSGGGGDGDK